MKLQHKYNRQTILLFLLVVGCMALIFRFSAQVASTSNSVSTHLTQKIVTIFVPNYHQMDVVAQAKLVKKVNHYVRKMAHFSIYLLLGALLLAGFTSWKRFPKGKNILFSAGIGLCYAISDECHQLFVSGRGPEIRDVCIDFAGVIVGIGICFLIIYLFRLHKKENVV